MATSLLVGGIPSLGGQSIINLCSGDLRSVSSLGIVGYLGTGVGVGVGVGVGIGIGRSFGNEKGSGPCVCRGSAIVLVGSREWVAGFRSAKASQFLKKLGESGKGKYGNSCDDIVRLL